MIVYGCCVGGDGGKFADVALPRLESVMRREDILITESGDDLGICRAYNRILDQALDNPECEAVVLLHDDLEIVDADFRSKVLRVVSESDAGVAGVAGSRGLTSLAWWEARATVGKVYESRGLLEFSERSGPVDALDGMLLVLAPAAFRRLRFDEGTFPRFHGYDVDYCLQAKRAGLQVVVVPLDVLHRAKSSFGSARDAREYHEAAAELLAKWPASVAPRSTIERMRVSAPKAGRRLVRGLRRVRGAVQERRLLGDPAVADDPRPTPAGEAVQRRQDTTQPRERRCPACNCILMHEHGSATPVVLTCPGCGTGIIDPPPARNLVGSGVFDEMYGGGDQRLKMRPIWFEEARKRLEWLLLYKSHGRLIEIGCGTGEFVRTACDEGFDAEGVEVSDWAASQAARLGAPIITGFLSDWAERQRGARVDIVAMWHVLEHVEDPLALLRECLAVMRPGAVLVLEVPNGGAEDLQRLGIEWHAAGPADHFYLFSASGIRTLLSAAGFEVRDVFPITRRLYSSAVEWDRDRAEALIQGYAWPSFDFLRAVAEAPHLANASQRT